MVLKICVCVYKKKKGLLYLFSFLYKKKKGLLYLFCIKRKRGFVYLFSFYLCKITLCPTWFISMNRLMEQLL
jgi:hypothetical protein